MTSINTSTDMAPFAPEKVNKWFDELVSTLRADHLMFETNVASDEKKKNVCSFL